MVWTSDQTAALIGQQQQMAMQGQQMAQSVGAGLHMPMPVHPGIHGLGRGAAGNALSAAAAPLNLANKVTGFAGMGMMGVGLGGWAGGKMGLGVTGRGLMGSVGGLGGGSLGALASLPAFAGVGALAYGANQMVSGYRETAQVGNMMSQNYSFANPNAFSGQGFNPKDVSQIAKTMRSVATTSQTGMDDIMQTFQSMSDMGMMQTVRSAQDFEKKFKGMIDSVKKISHTFSTSMTEAAELLGSMRSSGLYTAQDVLGGTLQRQVLGTHGLSAQQVTGLERSGAATAAQIGARRGTGARLNTGLAAAVGTAARMGVISSEDLIEATGMEGADAYAAMGQRLGEASMQFTQGQAGQAAMIYAGEMKDGRFTGRMNAGAMDDILSGRVGIDKMLSVAGERTQDVRGKASFAAKSHEMSGNFAQGGGNEAMMAIVRSIVDKLEPGADKNDMITLVMDKIAGVDRQTAAFLVKMSGEYDDIRREQGQEARQLIQSRAREYEREHYRSWGGVKRRIKQGWKESVSDPIKGVGGDIGTDIEMGVESIANTIYGRYESSSLSDDQMRRLQTMSQSERSDLMRGALIGQVLDTDNFSEATRLQMKAFSPSGSVKITEDNVDKIMDLVARETGMGAGVGVLQHVDQDRVTTASRGLGALMYDKGIKGDKKKSAEQVLDALMYSKEGSRTAGQREALAIIREIGVKEGSGLAHIGTDRIGANAIDPASKGRALEAVTAIMRGGGREDFGGGTFRANALEELAQGGVDASMSDLFNRGKGAWAERAVMNTGGIALGGIAGAVAAPLAWMGSGILAGMGLGAAGGLSWGAMQRDKRGSLDVTDKQASTLERMMDDPAKREAIMRILKGDILETDVDAWKDFGGGGDNPELSAVFGEAGGEQAQAMAAAVVSMSRASPNSAAAIRGNLTRVDKYLTAVGGTRISSALADEGSKLLGALKSTSRVKGDLKDAIVKYAEERASGRDATNFLADIVAALPPDKVKRKAMLRAIGNLGRGAGATLKAQLEAYDAVSALGPGSDEADITGALERAGVEEGLVDALGGKISDTVSGDLSPSELAEVAAGGVGLSSAASIAQSGGTRVRSMHVETALMTKMEGLIGGMDTLITSQTLAIESMDKVVEGHDKKLIELEKHP